MALQRQRIRLLMIGMSNIQVCVWVHATINKYVFLIFVNIHNAIILL